MKTYIVAISYNILLKYTYMSISYIYIYICIYIYMYLGCWTLWSINFFVVFVAPRYFARGFAARVEVTPRPSAAFMGLEEAHGWGASGVIG